MPVVLRFVRGLSLAALILAVAGLVGRDAPGAQPAGKAAADSATSEALAAAEWYGELEAGERQLRFAIEKGAGVAPVLRSFDEGDRRFPLDGFSDAGGKLLFSIKATGAAYVAEVGADGVAKGTWSQRGRDVPLAFRRVAAGETMPPEPLETWAGTLDAVVQKLPLRFRIVPGPDGKRVARMDSLAQKAGGFRGDLTIDGAEWTIDVPGTKGSFKGTLRPDGKLAGDWRQGGAILKLELEKVAAGAAAAQPPAKPRPQTPRAPFPYRVLDAAIPTAAAGVTLAGTLTLPEGEGPFPAVVLVSGSGPQDRDETIMDHKPFLVLADALTRAGIGVLRYDDRGHGASTGDASQATSADFAADAGAAVDWLRSRPGIDPRRIVVAGHSEGGLIAAMLAAARPDLAGIVMLAGTGVDGRRILVSQGELVLRSEGLGDEKAIRRSRVMQEAMLDAVCTAEVGADPAALAATAEAEIVAALPEEMAAAGETERKALSDAVTDGIRRLSAPWFKFFVLHDPAVDLAKVACPVLALVGEKDVQVDPKLNLPAIRQALAANPDATVEELPGLNHLFQNCRTGAVSEYDRIEETFAPAAIERLRGWLVERFGAK